LAACRSSDPIASAPQQAIPVETAVVTAADVDVTVAAVGTLEADQRVDVQPKRPGHIRELRIVEGGPVSEGEVLAMLADDDLRARSDQARASVADAEVRERNSRQQFDRTQSLLKKGVASAQQYDDAKADLDRAIAALGVARANLAFAQAQLAETVIRAPFAGLVGQRRVDVGAFVKEGETLVTLVDVDPMKLVFSVPERYLGEVALEQRVQARVASYGEREFPGTVSFIDPQVDPVNRTVTVKALVPNPEFALRPGQFATVTLHLDVHPGVPVIPEEAVVPDGERLVVFVVADGVASAREIHTGVRLPGRVEVVDGVRPGEVVVRTGHEKLKTGVGGPVAEVQLQGGG
jgi:membrane fusion protein (multidrug efflux system)